MKRIYSYNKFNESIRDMMTPKSEEEIRIATRNMFLGHPIKFFMTFQMTNDELKTMFTEQELAIGMTKYAESLFLLMEFDKNDTTKLQLDEFKGIVWYLFNKGYMFRQVDNLGNLWFKHHTKSAYRGGEFSVNKYSTLKDAKDYVERMEKLDEGVRSMMTPKTKEEIDDELEDLEPLERVTVQLNNQLDDINNKIEPYYSQSEVDGLCEELVELLNYSHDTEEMIDTLYIYIDLSDVIKRELKYRLGLLSPQDQVQYIHDIRVLGSLYTDKELTDLGVMSKKRTNESVRDMMTPMSEKDIKLTISKLSPTDKLIVGCRDGQLWIVKEGLKEGGDIKVGHDTPFIWACKNGHLDIVRYLLENVEGIEINTTNASPIRYACTNGHTDVVKYLVENGGDANSVKELPRRKWNEIAEILNPYRKNKIELEY